MFGEAYYSERTATGESFPNLYSRVLYGISQVPERASGPNFEKGRQDNFKTFANWLTQNWDQGDLLRDRFYKEARLTPFLNCSEELAEHNDLAFNWRVVRGTEQILTGVRKDLADFMSLKLRNDPNVLNAAKRVSVSKKLLESYVALTAPTSLIDNDAIASLFYGDRRIAGGQELLLEASAAYGENLVKYFEELSSFNKLQAQQM